MPLSTLTDSLALQLALAAPGHTSLLWPDWLVIASYILVIIGAGIWAQHRAKAASSREYFLAGRNVPVWAVAISTLATAQSAATFVGVPQDSYQGNLTYLSANIGGLLATIVLALVFIPAYYRLNVSTPYQLLETRFGPSAKMATSGVYLLGRVFASGARIYVGAIPVAIAFFGERTPANLTLCIAVFMVFAILYTLWGGLESVIWTDVVQVAVYLGAAIVAVFLIYRAIPADAEAIFSALRTGGPEGASKLTVFQLGIDTTKPLLVDPAIPFTLITACTGWMLLNLAAFGTDQDLVQRLLTCRSAASGSRSVITSMLVGIPVVLVFAAVGLLLWVVYNRPDIMGRPTPDYIKGDTADIFLKFVLHELPGGPAGLVIAGVLAAGPAGVNASLNSMGGTFISDFYKPLTGITDERRLIRAGRIAVCIAGLILGVFAVACIWLQQSSGENIINFVLGVMVYAYAGLLGVFLTALFTKRGNATTVIAAMITGFVVVLLLMPQMWKWWTPLLFPDWKAPAIATPWRLVIGTVCATIVCLLGRRRQSDVPTPTVTPASI